VSALGVLSSSTTTCGRIRSLLDSVRPVSYGAMPAPTQNSHGMEISVHDAACSVISEMSERLLPPVVPSVEIHTKTVDVGVRVFTGMLLWPGRIGVGGVSSVVSASLAGVAVGEERICTMVPVLSRLTVTALRIVGCGSCSSNCRNRL
jgi:hypothetical protein